MRSNIQRQMSARAARMRLAAALASLAMLAGGAMPAQSGPTTARELTTILGLGPHAAAGPYEGFPGIGVPVGTQWGEALDPTGTYLYASDSTNHVVRRLNLKTGTVVTVAGTSGTPGSTGDNGPATAALLNTPKGLAVDGNSNLYIADSGNHTVRFLDVSAGTITTVAGAAGQPGSVNGASSRLNSPSALLLTSGNVLLIGDAGNHLVRSYTPSTGLTATYIGLYGQTGYSSSMVPDGLASDTSGIFIADSARHVILQYNSNNNAITTYAGSAGNPGFAGDGGSKTGALFNTPTGLYNDGAGSLYIADTGNRRIRQIAISTAQGLNYQNIRTAAGNGAPVNYLPMLKQTATSPGPAGGTLPAVTAITGSLGTMYVSGGNASAEFGGTAGPGSVDRLSREDGIVIPRFQSTATGTASAYIDLESSNTIGTISIPTSSSSAFHIVSNTCASSAGLYTCHVGIQFDSNAGPQVNRLQVRTQSIGNVVTYTNFTLRGESYKYNAAVLPQATFDRNLFGISNPNQYSLVQPSDAVLNLQTQPVFTDRLAHSVYLVDNGPAITLLAGSGNGTSGYSGDGGSPASALLNAPEYVVQAPNGIYYVADTGNHVVRAIDRDNNTITTVAGNGTFNPPVDNIQATQSTFSMPMSLALTQDNGLLVADFARNTVRRVDLRTGIITTIGGNGYGAHTGDGGPATSAMLYGPSGLAVGPDGSIYIAEQNGNTIRRIDPQTGRISTVVGSPQASQNPASFLAPLATSLTMPRSLAVDASGGLLIADTGNNNEVRYISHPTDGSSEAAKSLPFFTATLNQIISVAPGLVLDGVTLRMPNGGFLLFPPTSAASHSTSGPLLLTAVSTGTNDPASASALVPAPMLASTTNYGFDISSSTNVFPYCAATPLLSGEACQIGLVFHPQTGAAAQSDTGTVGAAATVQAPFSLLGDGSQPLTYTSGNPALPMLNTPYADTLGTVSNGTAPYAVQVTSGAPPPGLVVSVDGANVRMTGTPTQPGAYSFTIRVTDAASAYADGFYGFDVQDTVQLNVAETVQVSDAVVPAMAVQLNVAETVSVADMDVEALAQQLPISEGVLVADTVSITVSQAIQFPAPASPITYGSATSVALTATGGASGMPVVFSASGPGSVTGSTLTITGAGTIAITANQDGSTYYSAAPPVQRNLVVTKASSTLSVPPSATTAAGTNTALNGTVAGQFTGTGIVTPSGNVSYSVFNATSSPVDSGTATINAGTFTVQAGSALTPGNYTVRVTYAGDSRYMAANFVSTALTVTAQSQTIQFTPPQTPVVYGSVTTLPLVATGGGSGNAVTFSATGTGSATGNTLSINGAGTIVVSANQAGNATYSAAPQVQQTVTVTKASSALQTPATQSFTVGQAGSIAGTLSGQFSGTGIARPSGNATYTVYDANNKPVDADTLPVINGSFSVPVKSFFTTGTYSVVVSYSGDSNYAAAVPAKTSLTVSQIAQTITFDQPASPLVYGAVTTVPLSASGGSSGNAITFIASGPASVSGTTLAITGAGSILITANQTGNDTYAAAFPVSRTVVVSPAASTLVAPDTATVSAGADGSFAVAAKGQYAGSNINQPSGTLSYSVVNAASVAVDTGTVTLGNGTGTVPLKAALPAGKYTVAVKYAGDANYNAASPVNTALTVSLQQVTVVWPATATLTYGGTLSQVLNPIAKSGNTSVAGTFTYTIGGSAISGATLEPVGKYVIAAQFAPADPATYSTATSSLELTVTPVPVTVTVKSDLNPVLAGNTVTLTATVSNPAAGGTVDFKDGATVLAAGVTVQNGSAAFTSSALSVGKHVITASYNSSNYSAGPSNAVTLSVEDFSLVQTGGAGTVTPQTITPGGTATYSLLLSPSGSVFLADISLSLSGLPDGAMASIDPTSIPAGAGATTVTVKISLPQNARLEGAPLLYRPSVVTTALALMLFPFAAARRRRLRAALMMMALAVGAGAVSGCGTSRNPSTVKPGTYAVLLTAKSGSTSRVITLPLTVQ